MWIHKYPIYRVGRKSKPHLFTLIVLIALHMSQKAMFRYFHEQWLVTELSVLLQYYMFTSRIWDDQHHLVQWLRCKAITVMWKDVQYDALVPFSFLTVLVTILSSLLTLPLSQLNVKYMTLYTEYTINLMWNNNLTYYMLFVICAHYARIWQNMFIGMF